MRYHLWDINSSTRTSLMQNHHDKQMKHQGIPFQSGQLFTLRIHHELRLPHWAVAVPRHGKTGKTLAAEGGRPATFTQALLDNWLLLLPNLYGDRCAPALTKTGAMLEGVQRLEDEIPNRGQWFCRDGDFRFGQEVAALQHTSAYVSVEHHHFQ